METPFKIILHYMITYTYTAKNDTILIFWGVFFFKIEMTTVEVESVVVNTWIICSLSR